VENLKERKKAFIRLTSEANRYKYICETLRLIYDEVYKIPDNKVIVELLVDAMMMAKSMQDRLIYYKEKYHDTTGSGGKNIEKLYGVAERKQMRRNRK
jgi:hypothetical protein